jgi:hypothetical protein
MHGQQKNIYTIPTAAAGIYLKPTLLNQVQLGLVTYEISVLVSD